MKRMLRSQYDPAIMNIDVNITFVAEPVFATNVTPILDDQGNIDDDAMSNYQTFVENTWAMLDYYGFQMLSNTESGSYPHTSKYYWIAYASDVESGSVPLMIKLRISDHKQSFSPEFVTKLHKRDRFEADSLKLPESKKQQRYRTKEIIVNSTKYDTYEEALNAIEVEVHKWLTDLGVDMSEFPEALGPW